MLVDRERFAGDGRLVNLEKGIFSNNATVSRNDGAL
jgi:hypothetical protein